MPSSLCAAATLEDSLQGIQLSPALPIGCVGESGIVRGPRRGYLRAMSAKRGGYTRPMRPTLGTSTSTTATSTTTTSPITTACGWCEPEREPAKVGANGSQNPPAPAAWMAFSLRDIDKAYQACRAQKRNKPDAIAYQARLLDHLFATLDSLNHHTWKPSAGTVFITTRPKLREVHAAPFGDRVVQHVLVDVWQPLLEPGWIEHSYANRVGKGTHGAVDALQAMLRSASAQFKSVHYLQLDIANFFHSIDLAQLKLRLAALMRKQLKRGRIERSKAVALWRATAAILDDPTAARAVKLGPARRFAAVPMHKRLSAQGLGKGLPIGNLTSQFFGNVVLDQLDQFVKHQLKARWYVRYVDDFVLLAPDAETLARWHCAIETFLMDVLQLRLKPGSVAKPIKNGIDFLGYVIRPSYRLARRRVVRRCWSVLKQFELRQWRQTDADGQTICLPWQTNEQKISMRAAAPLQQQLASYIGHFRHAASGRLWARLVHRFSWLNTLFALANESTGALFMGCQATTGAGLGRSLQPFWRLTGAPRALSAQLSQFRRRLRALARQLGASAFSLIFQCGNRWRVDGRPDWLTERSMQALCLHFQAEQRCFAVLAQTGVQRDGRRAREIRTLHICALPVPPTT